MEIEWDEDKRQAVLAERDLDLLTAALIFEGPVLTVEDDREGYGERRFRSLGVVDGAAYVVVWTPRGAARRIVTAWHGGRRDRETYRKSFAE